ncbi:MAG: SCP2 sterol-binding domain-containing protein [Firmicutes bacterium]|nr:SCP2 sterol-binding domain-containing protein [Bacillota bacterium]
MAGYESAEELQRVVQHLVELMKADERVLKASTGSTFTVGFAITDLDETFLLTFKDGQIGGEVGADITPAQIKLTMDSETFDGVFGGEVDPMGAAMSGQITFSGDLGLAMNLLGVVDDLRRIYKAARAQAGTA